MLRTNRERPRGRSTNKRNEHPPPQSTPLAAEEMSRCYQFSAHTASVCCIAMGAHERRQLWVKSAVADWSASEVMLPLPDWLRYRSNCTEA